MSRFAGADPRKIHHLERDRELLIELPHSVQILAIVATQGDVSSLFKPAGRKTGHDIAEFFRTFKQGITRGAISSD